MRTAELFRSARIAKGFKQSALAELGGISCSALARFEADKLRLSEDTLQRIAPYLDVNPKYLEGNSVSPFMNHEQGLIKFFIDKYHLHSDPILATILATSENLEFYSLSPHLSILERIRHLNIADNPTYAMIIRDEFDNTFIFRCKSNKDFMAWDARFISLNAHLMKITNKVGQIINKIISKDLYDKIADWNSVSLEDLQHILQSKKQSFKLQTVVYSEEETEMVIEFRDNHVNPVVAMGSIGLLRDIERMNIDPEEAREILKRYYEH